MNVVKAKMPQFRFVPQPNHSNKPTEKSQDKDQDHIEIDEGVFDIDDIVASIDATVV